MLLLRLGVGLVVGVGDARPGSGSGGAAAADQYPTPDPHRTGHPHAARLYAGGLADTDPRRAANANVRGAAA